MAVTRLTPDIVLSDLLEELPESKDILYEHGLKKLEDLDILDVVADKLTLRGFFKLMDIDELTQGKIWQEIQNMYSRKTEG